jgi:hypothetical protein
LGREDDGAIVGADRKRPLASVDSMDV